MKHNGHALHSFDRYAFEEIYTAALLYLEEVWTATGARYVDFQPVLNHVRTHVFNTLAREPSNIREFHALMCDHGSLEELDWTKHAGRPTRHTGSW